MKKSLLLAVALCCSGLAFAEGSASIALAPVTINSSDIEAIKRGAKFFGANCMACHTLKYLRYDKLAQEQGLTYEKMPINVKTWPNGIVPPDLSLEADVRGEDWIYTYLHSFYQDTTRPSGVNNLLVPNTSMPGIIMPFQGTQLKVDSQSTAALHHEAQWYDLLVLQKQGSMTPDQFDATISDLVNFLAYAAHPYEAQQHWLGIWVISFLTLLLVLAYALKKEYWRDIKNKYQANQEEPL
jgi:ubiquinol-cytochrome c reductase cytochrome c1 subunit